MKRTRGFTLIELLVVIAIIGLLSSIVLASLNIARSRGRNATRVVDIESLRTAFTLGYSSGYPDTGGAWVCISSSCYGGWSVYGHSSTVDSYLMPANIAQEPDDPADSSRGYGGYLYNSSWSGGPYFTWLTEIGGSCGPGTLYAQTSAYIECLLSLQ